MKDLELLEEDSGMGEGAGGTGHVMLVSGE